MKNYSKKKVAGILEISAIALLTAALIIMFAEYCRLVQSASVYYKNENTDIFRENIHLSGSENMQPLGLLSPVFIGISSEKKLAPTDAAIKKQLISDAKPFILGVFSDVSTVMEFSSEKAKNDYLEQSVYNKDYLYLSFIENIPANAFIPAISGNAIENAYHAFGVKELFICCDNNGMLSGTAIDDNGNIASLSVREQTSLSFDTLRAYINSDGMSEFEFTSAGNKMYPVYTSSVSTFNIAAYNNSGGFLESDSENLSGVLKAFGFNPNGTRFYRTGNSYVTYVEDIGELRISSSGDITYSPTGSGISLAELCGKTKKTYSFEDKISAAYNIISKLDKNYYGGYANLIINTVVYDGENLTVSMIYSADGIPIDSETPAASLIFGENFLVSAQVNARSFTKLGSTYSDIPQKLLFVFSSQNFLDSALPRSFIPVYTQNDVDAVYNAKYAFIYDSENAVNTLTAVNNLMQKRGIG